MRTYISKADILYHLRVNVRFFNDFLEQRINHVIKRSIFEAPLEGLGQWRPDCECDDYIIRVFLRTVVKGYRGQRVE